MGSPTGLALECRPSTTTTTCASGSFSFPNDLHRMHRLEEYLNALEEERRKIEAFKRELPFCMQLLHDAIEAYKEQLAVCKPSSQRWPQIQVSSSFNDTDSNLQSPSDPIILEEFIPLKKPTSSAHQGNSEDELPQKRICKPNWMKAGGCLNAQAEPSSHTQERCQPDLAVGKISLQRLQEQAFSTSSKPFFHSKNKSGGAFMPFSREKLVQPTPRPGALKPTDLALAPRDPEVSLTSLCENRGSLPKLVKSKPREDVQQQLKELVVKASGEGTEGSNGNTHSRKARRCWSPDLHRRFVNALQQLGGSQIATPKQIRELMKVEGLTNDEVKSHLQKYRLHTRRPSPSQTTSAHTPQVVVLGGIWVPPEYAAHAVVQQAPALYNPSQQPPRLCQTSSSQELCSQLGSPGQMHLHSSFCCDQKSAPAHSQCSLHGPTQLTGQSSQVFHLSDDAGREESVGDDGASDNSCCKGCEPGLQLHDVDETENQSRLDDSINANQSHCTGEDDTEIEDSRGSETSLKM